MTDSLDNYQKIALQWQQQREKDLKELKDAATEVAKNLKTRGITQIEFRYCGYGDSGCIEECLCSDNATLSTKEREKLEDLVYELLPDAWEINNGSAGTVTFNLETGEVSVDHKWLEYVDDDIPGVELNLNEESED